MERLNLEELVRPNIRSLIPYSSARDEFKGTGATLMDANESPFNSPLNRYPDPLQKQLKQKISSLLSIDPGSIFLGNGSDEAIDLLIRAFCNPGKDNIISLDPSYGMYEVCAGINDIESIKVMLNPDFSLDPEHLLSVVNANTKLIFLCSPNNPTSNLLEQAKVLDIVRSFKGLTVVDEAYIDFSGSQGLLPFLAEHPSLVILRTFSKAWSLAGVRLGMALADERIISILNKIKYPYNINVLTQRHVLGYLDEHEDVDKWVNQILSQRNILQQELPKFAFVKKVYHSDANFLLVSVENARKIYLYLRDNGLVVRDRSKVALCQECLRITVGAPEENAKLLELLGSYSKDQ